MNPTLKGFFTVHWLPGALALATNFTAATGAAVAAGAVTAAPVPTIPMATKTANACLILIMSSLLSNNDTNLPVTSLGHRRGQTRRSGSP